MAASLSIWWLVGAIVGLVVVLVAAGLLLTIIVLGRRIVGQANEISDALEGARQNTVPLFDVSPVNLALDRTARGMRALREEGR